MDTKEINLFIRFLKENNILKHYIDKANGNKRKSTLPLLLNKNSFYQRFSSNDELELPIMQDVYNYKDNKLKLWFFSVFTFASLFDEPLVFSTEKVAEQYLWNFYSEKYITFRHSLIN